MKLSKVILIGTAAAGLVIAAAWRFGRKQRPLEITTEDLEYQEHSPEELASENLLDLNTATKDDLARLGLDAEVSDRILENRPYRNKLDLLSRMVVPEQTYNIIKDQIGVAGATESVKIA